MGDKKCPRCAEMVKSDAGVCRYCNHKFGILTPKNLFMGGATAVVLLMLLGKTEQDTPTTKAIAETTQDQRVSTTPVTIAELVKAYDENEARAQANYSNQTLLIQGTVTDIDLGLTNNPIVTLLDGDVTINTYFDKDRGGPGTVDLVKGQQAAIACNEVSETLGSPSLHDCFVADMASARPTAN